jgi:hypothetical protein
MTLILLALERNIRMIWNKDTRKNTNSQ